MENNLINSETDFPNIVLIVIDALRPDCISCYGSKTNASPTLNNIAKDGVWFDSSFCCYPGTDPSLTTISSGRYPIAHGILHHGQEVTEDERRTLKKGPIRFVSEILSSIGYTTIGIDWMDRWHSRGYDHYDWPGTRRKYARRFMDKLKNDIPDFFWQILEKINATLQPKGAERGVQGASKVTEKAIEHLNKHADHPFFLFIHYWDTHFPYGPYPEYMEEVDAKKPDLDLEKIEKIPEEARDPVRERLGKLTSTKILERYLGAIRHVDSNIGRLIDVINNRYPKEKNLFLITSDHGEGLTECGILGHTGFKDSVIKIPLIFAGEGIPSGKVINDFVQSFDIAPTLLDFVGLDYEEDMFDGRSLSKLIKGEPIENRSEVLVEGEGGKSRCIRSESWKYIWNSLENSSKKEELYDLREGEKTNKAEQRPRVRDKMKKRMSCKVKEIMKRKEKSRIRKKVNKINL